MKTTIYTFVILLSATMLLVSCNKKDAAKPTDVDAAVTIKTKQLSDQSAFKMSNGERCVIIADASIDYPVAVNVEGARVDSLQRLFAAYVLESGDSLSLQEAMKQIVANSMHQYDFMEEPVGDDVAAEAAEAGEESMLEYATSTRVTPVYNINGIVTFERVDVIKKNGTVTSVTHRYYSFDVENSTYIDVNRLFRDDALTDVCQLLRQELLKQNNAKGNEQLNDLGYFNVENITVSRNFYFEPGGVTWSYLPNELAVEAVGEPKITIPYGDLEPFECENSIIARVQ